VLDTKGINVWCAAGKGTFGTDEIVRRVQGAGLERIVSHRTLIVPQLGAPGVSAHAVRRSRGFHVVYGPVRAEDLPAFLDAGLKARPEMRRVRFGLGDRAVLIPAEIVTGGKYVLLAAAGLLLLGGLTGSWLQVAARVLIVPAIASFVLMNFTGAATYTSLGGALREMRFAVPAQIAGTVVGLGLWLSGLLRRIQSKEILAPSGSHDVL
jgi:acetyl-CoA decarbonylase/synthase complex subunit gamma